MGTVTPTAAGIAWEDLSSFPRTNRDGRTTFDIAVKGARCANCIAKIETGVKSVPGVEDARLNLSTGKLCVSWSGRNAAPDVVLNRVRTLGYEASPYEAAAALDANAAEGRFLLRCMSVAGFGAIFVMGLMDAIWYGGHDMSAATRNMFLILAGTISVPVTLYASQPFFRSAYRALANRNSNMDVPISLAILLALLLSTAQTIAHGTQIYFDAAVMLAFLLLIGRYLDYLLRDRARGAAKQLAAMQSMLARRLRADGTLETVSANAVMPGDRLFVASGERVPVDARVEGTGVDADISLVTGESAPVLAGPGSLLRAGSIVAGASAVLVAAARAEDSLLADLARLLEMGQQNRSHYVRLADRAARAYVPFVLGMAVLIAVGWLLVGATVTTALTNAIAVLVITCPCALGLAVPAVQIVATSRLFERGIIVKSGDALERLAEADTAIFDKTGTLTSGKPELLNRGDIPPQILQQAAQLARASNHPLARALAAAAGDGPVAMDVREVPGSGLEATLDGAICRVGSAAWCGLPPGKSSELCFRAGDQPAVRFLFRDTIQSDAPEIVAALQKRGIRVEILSGDRDSATAELAARAGVLNWKAGVDPKEKAAHLERLRKEGRRVLMIGDGLNDTGALALAHVSIAPGTAVDAAQSAADMVLRGNHLLPIAEAVDVARKARRLVLQNFALAVLYNSTAIPLAMFGLVTPLVAAATMAGSSLAVILNALRAVRTSAS